MLKDDGVLGCLALLQVEALDHALVLHSRIDSLIRHSLVFRLNCRNRLEHTLGLFIELILILEL